MTTTDRYVSEKRDFIRMTIESPATIKWQEQTIECVCQDLSAIGARVLAETAIPLNQEVTFEVPSQIDRFDPLVSQAIVTRCDVSEDKFEIGLKVVQVK